MELKGWKAAREAAKLDRQRMSPAEVRLWLALRAEPGGHRFRRQHAAGPYRLNFYCATARLCVEVDGEAHGFGTRPERDAARDMWLAGRGVRTLRVPAAEVFADVGGVVRHILETIASG